MAQTKREKAIKAAVVPGKSYAFEDAINILKTATKAKEADLTAADLDAAVRTIAGSARSMGLKVEG